MKRILVFPCGSEIALEIYRSLKYSIHFELVGASSIDDHGKFVYKEYIGDDTQTYDIEGTIKRIGFDVNDGNTTYYIILEEDNKLYYGSSTINREINISNVGDKIKISVNNNRIVNFDNLNI